MKDWGSPFEFEDWIESELIWKSFSFIVMIGTRLVSGILDFPFEDWGSH